MATTYATIGLPVGRAEGPEKVTGAAVYPADITLPGTLVGKCLRSPYAYARILSIDASAARRVPGVHAVLTGFDIPEMLVGRFLRDMPTLARDVVRFVGQKVAAVAAEDIDAAEEAMQRIEVEYEELTPVLDPLEAMRPDAPVLHPDFMSYIGRVPGPQEHPNITAHATWKNGDIEAVWAPPTMSLNTPSAPRTSTRPTLNRMPPSSLWIPRDACKCGSIAKCRFKYVSNSLKALTSPRTWCVSIRRSSGVISAARALSWTRTSPTGFPVPRGGRSVW